MKETAMRTQQAGFSLMEILVVVTILGILAVSSVPFAELTFIREKESEFNENLQTIRKAIRSWKRDFEQRLVQQMSRDALNQVREELTYPPDLGSMTKTLPYTVPIYDGVATKTFTFYHPAYIRVIPPDPFIGAPVWIQHYNSNDTSTVWSMGTFAGGVGTGVFDISAATGTIRRGFDQAVDGTFYQDW